MNRRVFVLGLASGAALAAAAGPALANSFAEDVIAQLNGQGFLNITVETTWLGRVRIVAERDGGTREIILNPRTGEILRDMWTPLDGSRKTKNIIDDIGDGSGSGGTDGGGDGGTDGGGGTGGGGSDDGHDSHGGKDDKDDDDDDDKGDDKGDDKDGKDN